MGGLKPIETHWKGYRFRSRLEARWAICLDALGVAWEYEPEGFVLPEVGAYLPDFRLPGLRCWLEIKPTYPTNDEARKAAVLAQEAGEDVFILIGGQFEPLRWDSHTADLRGTRIQQFHPERYDDEGDLCLGGWAECIECLHLKVHDDSHQVTFVGIPGSRHWQEHSDTAHPGWNEGEFVDLGEANCGLLQANESQLRRLPYVPGVDESKRVTKAYRAALFARFEHEERERG